MFTAVGWKPIPRWHSLVHNRLPRTVGGSMDIPSIVCKMREWTWSKLFLIALSHSFRG